MPKKKTEKGRKIELCEACGAEITYVHHLGEKHAVDVRPTSGFVFIEDEYGHDIGSVELASVHASHSETCIDTEKLSAPSGDDVSDIISPLEDDDDRTEFLTLEDGSTIELDAQMRHASPETYVRTCAKAILRVFPGDELSDDLEEIEPLEDDDERAELFTMPAGDILRVDFIMRLNDPLLYAQTCEKAVSREFEGDEGGDDVGA